MALEMMFQDTSTEVNVSSQGGKKASRMIDNIASKPTDTNIFDVVKSGATALGAYIDINNAIDADDAKRDFNNIVRSEGYMEADDVHRAEMLEEVYNSMGDRSTHYQEAFTEYSSPTYQKVFDSRLEVEKNAIYSKLPAYQRTWKKETGNEDPKAFVGHITSKYPYLDKAVVNTGLVAGIYEEAAMDIASANNPTELGEAMANLKEAKKPYNNPTFLQTKSMKGMTQVSQYESNLKTLVTQKQQQFKFEAQQNIIRANNPDSPYVEHRYTTPPDMNKYGIAYGEKAEGKYTTDMHKYNEHQIGRQKGAEFEFTETTNWSAESDVTKEIYQQNLTDNILDALDVNINGAAEAISVHGATDSKRLKDVREYFNSGLSSEEGAKVYKKMLRLKAEDSSAFNMLYPDREERAKMIAMGPMHQLLGGTFNETWKYMQGTPDIVPEKTTRTAQKEIDGLTHDKDIPVDLRKDIDVMYSTMGKYGINHKERIKAIKEYKESKPYELNLDKYSGNTKDIMEWSLPMMVPEGSTTYQDPSTGMIMAQNEYGLTYPVMKKQEFIDYSTSINNINLYNDEHYIKKGFESFADFLTSKIGQVSEKKDMHGNQFSYSDGPRKEIKRKDYQDPILYMMDILTNDINLGTGKSTKESK